MIAGDEYNRFGASGILTCSDEKRDAKTTFAVAYEMDPHI